MENIILDSTKTLMLGLDAATTSNPVDVTVSYVDISSSGTLTDGAQETHVSSITPPLSTILSSPTGSPPPMRNALTVTIVNNDTVKHIIKIYKATGAGNFLVTEQTLFPGESWDSNLSVNNTFDMAATIYNATPDASPNPASTIGFWESNTLRNMTLFNLQGWLAQTYLMPLVAAGPSQNVLTSNGVGWQSAAAPSGGGGGGRVQLTTNSTYFVSPTGHDLTGDGSSGNPWQTIQHAVNKVCALDISIYNVTIQLAAGTYIESPTLYNVVGTGSITIIGNTTTPSTVVIDGGFSKTGPGTIWTLEGMYFIKNTSSTTQAIAAYFWAQIQFGYVTFGTGFSQQIISSYFALIYAIANYTISGGATEHIDCNSGNFLMSGLTITLTGTPAFSIFLYEIGLSNATIVGNTFSGSATGTRYYIILNSIANTNGATLPGNSAGATASGGQYV